MIHLNRIHAVAMAGVQTHAHIHSFLLLVQTWNIRIVPSHRARRYRHIFIRQVEANIVAITRIRRAGHRNISIRTGIFSNDSITVDVRPMGVVRSRETIVVQGAFARTEGGIDRRGTAGTPAARRTLRGGLGAGRAVCASRTGHGPGGRRACGAGIALLALPVDRIPDRMPSVVNGSGRAIISGGTLVRTIFGGSMSLARCGTTAAIIPGGARFITPADRRMPLSRDRCRRAVMPLLARAGANSIR